MKAMKQIETIAKGQNFEAVNIGSWDEVIGYELPMGPNVLHGKVFVGQAVGATGSELSFQTLAPGQDSGFLHTHKTMRSFISLSRVKACTRLTAKSSLSSKDPLSVYRPMASEP